MTQSLQQSTAEGIQQVLVDYSIRLLRILEQTLSQIYVSCTIERQIKTQVTASQLIRCVLHSATMRITVR